MTRKAAGCSTAKRTYDSATARRRARGSLPAAAMRVPKNSADMRKPSSATDFAITEHFVVFYVLPVLVGDFRSAVPIRWADDFPARFVIIPRDGQNEDARWFDVAPCTISHTVNAYEDGETVVVDAVRAPKIMTPHALHRYVFDMRAGSATERQLDPRFLDFPRVSPAVIGTRHRYVYTTELCRARALRISRRMARRWRGRLSRHRKAHAAQIP